MAMTVFLIYRHFPWLQFIFDRSDIKERMSELKKKRPNFLRSFPNLSKIVIYNARIHICLFYQWPLLIHVFSIYLLYFS